jgi:putative phosphoesterase
MVVGIYSDLHCNLAAFDALLRLRKDADMWICAGDTVGLFPFVNEVVDRQRELASVAVKGDHELALVDGSEISDSFSGNQSIALQRAAISSVNLDYLSGLPLEADFEADGVEVRVRHALHGLTDRTLKFNLEHSGWDRADADIDVLVVGHTHLPAAITGKHVTLLNPGSLGFPVCHLRKPMAMLFDTATRTARSCIFETEVETLIEGIRRASYNSKLAEYLGRGFIWP